MLKCGQLAALGFVLIDGFALRHQLKRGILVQRLLHFLRRSFSGNGDLARLHLFGRGELRVLLVLLVIVLDLFVSDRDALREQLLLQELAADALLDGVERQPGSA